MILIFWSGYGFLVPLLFIGWTILLELSAAWIWGNNAPFILPLVFALVLTGISINLLSRFFAKRQKVYRNRNGIDSLINKKDSHFFFIPFVYWSYIMPVIGLVTLATYFITK
jgi:hypothetical protein